MVSGSCQGQEVENDPAMYSSLFLRLHGAVAEDHKGADHRSVDGRDCERSSDGGLEGPGSAQWAMKHFDWRGYLTRMYELCVPC